MLSVHTYPTLAEAAGVVGERAHFLAGGTLLMRGANYASQRLDQIVRTTETAHRYIRGEGGGLRLGAAATMSDVIGSGETAFLAPVARSIGGPAIRNMGTIGGNLFARHPFGDMAVALLALDGQVNWVDGRSEPMEAFLAQRQAARGVVESVSIPRPAQGEFRFVKVSRTKPKGAAVLTIAVWLRSQAGRMGDVRIAFGAMGETPLRAKAAEAALNGATLDDATLDAACRVACDGLAPMDDPLASAWYRREVAPVHLKRLLTQERRF